MIRRVYRDEAMSRARCFDWHAHFKRGRTSLDDDVRSGRASTSSTPTNVETIWRLVHKNRRRTIKGIAKSLMCHTEQCRQFSRDLSIHRVAAKFVPRFLIPEQKEHRIVICQELHQRAVVNPTFMSWVITGTRVGSMGIIPRLNNSHRNGRAQDPQDRRRGRAAVRPKACSSCFSRCEELRTMNLSLKARQ